MKNAARLAVLGFFAFALAACATQPQAAKRLDAKTTLENHR